VPCTLARNIARDAVVPVNKGKKREYSLTYLAKPGVKESQLEYRRDRYADDPEFKARLLARNAASLSRRTAKIVEA
jgi:hypothetical protein